MRLRSVDVVGQPIVTWPGPFTEDRRRAKFKAPWSATMDLLDRELHQLGAENVVLQLAIRRSDFRRDGLPKGDARADHPGVILTMDSPYGPLSYPCDRFTRWEDNLRAIALALEALRLVDRFGVTRRGEQYTGWRQLPAGVPMPPAMTRREAAEFIAKYGQFEPEAVLLNWPDGGMYYRRVARVLHPDHGGSPELFQRLQQAKRVLDGTP